MKTTGEVKVSKKIMPELKKRAKAYDNLLKTGAEEMAKSLSRYYDDVILRTLKGGCSLFYTGKFRKKRVPRYLWITIPIVERHYCCDDGECSESGWLITTRRIRLFKIGTEVIKVPVRRKFKKGKKIRFKRHGKLT